MHSLNTCLENNLFYVIITHQSSITDLFTQNRRIIYIYFIHNYLDVEYTSCHRKILFDLSFEKGTAGQVRWDHYHRRNVPCLNFLERTRFSKKAYLHTDKSPINFPEECLWELDDHRPVWRMDNRNVSAYGREITSNIRSASRSPILDRTPICCWQIP